MPFFSVVMACYNSKEYVKDAIESVISQTFCDWELIIVDDCSSDNSYSIASEYAKLDSRIRVYKLSENSGGCLVPRTKAIELSNGEYVTYLDSDDTFQPEYLSDIRKAVVNSGADVVLNIQEGAIPGITSSSTALGKDCLKHTLNGWEIATGLTFTKKKYFECLNGNKTESGVFFDEIITRLLILNAEKVAFSYAKYNYRKNPESITNMVGLKMFNRLESTLILRKIVKMNFPLSSVEILMVELQLFKELIYLTNIFATDKRLRLIQSDKNNLLNRLNDAWGSVDFNLIRKHLSAKEIALTFLSLRNVIKLMRFYAAVKGR